MLAFFFSPYSLLFPSPLSLTYCLLSTLNSLVSPYLYNILFHLPSLSSPSLSFHPLFPLHSLSLLNYLSSPFVPRSSLFSPYSPFYLLSISSALPSLCSPFLLPFSSSLPRSLLFPLPFLSCLFPLFYPLSLYYPYFSPLILLSHLYSLSSILCPLPSLSSTSLSSTFSLLPSKSSHFLSYSPFLSPVFSLLPYLPSSWYPLSVSNFGLLSPLLHQTLLFSFVIMVYRSSFSPPISICSPLSLLSLLFPFSLPYIFSPTSLFHILSFPFYLPLLTPSSLYSSLYFLLSFLTSISS